nr:uncharacterized protein LOC107442688 isoform X1 [Parasteatoda tepidariorum]
MRCLAIVTLLFSAYALVHSNCDLSNAKRDVDFPDIEKDGIESYQLSVEYTIPNVQQTNYYTEYYDLVERRGRIDAHQEGKSLSYMYWTQTNEAWEITEQTCTFKNATDTPDMESQDMIDWRYSVEGDDEKRTFGPSAMFKIARDVWNSTSRNYKMAYMGKTDFTIRGLKAQYWRRCSGNDNSYVDYYFTTDDEQDPLGTDLKRIPLRVYFGGKKDGMGEETSIQQYEIITLQPFISRNVYPFQLPKGYGCKRGNLEDTPELPDFGDTNLQFGAEVIYRKVNYQNEDMEYWSYYSTLTMAFDIESQHIAYYYTPWNTTKPQPGEEPSVLSPEYVIYDMKHKYAYKTDLVTGACSISRSKSFYPTYKLPNKGGELILTDGSILFPLSGMSYLSEGINRGLKVNVFEEIIENYILNNATEITVPQAIITHSYLKDDEMIRSSESVKNALVQIQVILNGREDKVSELLVFNFFNFDTEIKNRRFIFDVQRCFKNDNDYLWVTIGFNADEATLMKIRDDVPSIQSNIMNSLYSTSELNPVRVPTILVDIKEGLFVTLLILGKPPVLWDFLDPEKGKTLRGASDVDGVQDKGSCATKCLEEEDNCW